MYPDETAGESISGLPCFAADAEMVMYSEGRTGMRDSYVLYKDRLNDEYRIVFDQVEMYVLSQNIEDAAIEERLGELLDIFFSAMERGKPVSEITDTRLESFCKTFCSDFGVKNRILHAPERF